MFGFLKRIVQPEAGVRLISANPSGFVDACVRQNIPLRDIKPAQDGAAFNFKMRAGDFKKLKPIVKKTGSRVKITSRKGVAFATNRLRGRYMLAAGFVLLLGTFFLTTCFIWDIDVEGNVSISEREVLATLSDLGIKPGVKSFGHDVDKLENQMRLRLPATSWLAINIRGSHVDVLMRERTPIPLIIPDNVPCDIVAKKAGLLTDVRVYKGEAAVTSGRTVYAGQVLVNGHSVTANGVERWLHASADIYARTWAAKTAVLPSNITLTSRSGHSHTRRAIIFIGNRINLYMGSGNPFEFCDKIVKRREFSLFGVPLSFSIVTEEYYELETTEIPVRQALKDEDLKQWLKDWLMRGVEGEMVSCKLSVTEAPVVCYYRMECEFYELISKQVRLGSVNNS